MKSFSIVAAAVLAYTAGAAPAVDERDVDETFPYTGPEVPVGDWVDPTINGNSKGFPRLVEAPAVKPSSKNPTNNVNVISVSYLPNGVNIHYQTPFGLGQAPRVKYGKSEGFLSKTVTGASHTYDRTPSCSQVKAVTQCSQFFHEVQLTGLDADTTYYYEIPAANGTTKSDVLSFKTARAAGDKKQFTVAILNDMGYTNAKGTHEQLVKAADEGVAFAWHGGDISYADDWYSGVLPCTDDWPVCYNGSDTKLPGPAPVPDEYKNAPLPAGEVPNQGGPNGGDMSVIYESNWDLWQNWMSAVTTKIPYMVMPGNHEATCAEFDGGKNVLTAYLTDNKANSTAEKSDLNYYSCPPSQRNFTAFQHRFRMPGDEVGGVGNFWYSFDYGLAHFISIDSETDFPDSPSYTLAEEEAGKEGKKPEAADYFVTDAGPFGKIDGGFNENKAFQQWQWFKKDLENVDRAKTPWVFVMAHRPLYSSQKSSYQEHMRNAWEDLMLEHGVDAFLAGHIHWYERLLPLGKGGKIDRDSVKDNNTYHVNEGKSITYITNGAAGNIESHSTLDKGQNPLDITQVLDFVNYGFGKMTVFNESVARWEWVHGQGGEVHDHLTLLKGKKGNAGSSTSSVTPGSGSTPAATPTATSYSVSVTTEVVNEYTTYCPFATTLTQGSKTYTVTGPSTLTVTDCPCTLTHTTTVPCSAKPTSNVSNAPTGTAAPSESVTYIGTLPGGDFPSSAVVPATGGSAPTIPVGGGGNAPSNTAGGNAAATAPAVPTAGAGKKLAPVAAVLALGALVL